MNRFPAISLLFLAGFLSLEAQYVSNVLEYVPAPGQFINEAPWGVPSNASSLVGGVNGSVSLGAFGGYVVFRFEEPVENHPDNPYGVDFTLFGNPMPDWSEPGAVWVMPDENGNGLPDESWYELAGSDYWFSGSRLARVTYTNPAEEVAADVPWEDELGNSGFIRANSVHLQPYYPSADSFPSLPSDSYLVEGRLIAGKVDLDKPPLIKSYLRAFGYADNRSRGTGPDTLPDNPYTSKLENSGGDAFDIGWAVDSTGAYVDLEEVLFVKVQTAMLHEGGYLGELSTEITGAVDVAPDVSVSGPDRVLVLRDLPLETAADTLQLEVFCFEKGRPVDLPDLEWSTSVSWARVDEEKRLILEGKGELEVSVRVRGETDLQASSGTTVLAGDPVSSPGLEGSMQNLFYPNPATERIWFRESAGIRIYSLSGVLVKETRIISGGGSVECGQLEPGVYLLIIQSGASIINQKLVIQ